MTPNTHFISIKSNLSNMFSEMEEIMKNESKAKGIYEKANALA